MSLYTHRGACIHSPCPCPCGAVGWWRVVGGGGSVGAWEVVGWWSGGRVVCEVSTRRRAPSIHSRNSTETFDHLPSFSPHEFDRGR
eukprot:3563858-Prymnesium_polylepis.2